MSNHANLKTIKARGWSPRLIDTILGEPDMLATNPMYRSGPRVKLWLLKRVEAAEADPRFIAHAAK